METATVTEETKKEGTMNATTTEPSAPMAKPQEPTKRPRREDRNRKDDRNYDMFIKTVNAAPPSEQLNIATQKYVAMLDENKKMQFYIKQSDKRHAIILKEKEQLQLEFNKTVLLKSKLENLCRELQKQNKSIKDESLQKIREEEEKRKETQAKFQNTLSEISNLLQQNNEKNAKLREDNISMTEKFKSVVQQYQHREEQVDKMSKQMDLEGQLNAAKMQKASLEHQAERERLMAEVEILKSAVTEYQNKVKEMSGTETGLRGQLSIYTDKYDEFQSALMKSNQVFGGFKDQMEKMSKKIKQQEKESIAWKQRWESSQSALLEMCAERQASDTRLLALQRQLAHMQSLCRTLQAERTLLVGALKENNIERPPLPAPVPAPAPPPEPLPPAQSVASDAKVDAMAANCAQLRQSLAHLQSQLNDLTTQQTQSEEPAQVEKPKKNKNKKNKAKKLAEENKVPTEIKGTNEVSTDDVKTESKDVSKEVNQNVNTPIESVDLAEEKVNEKVLESLMQAINSDNVNLCDLEVVDGNNMSIEEVLDAGAKVIEITNDTDLKVVAITDDTDPKVVAITDDTNPKVVATADDTDPKVVAIADYTDPKVVAITDDTDPKVVEITNDTDPKDVEITNDTDLKVVAITDDTDPKVVAITDDTDHKDVEITNDTDPKVVVITDDTDPKVVESTLHPEVTKNGVAEPNIESPETVTHVVPDSPKKAESRTGSPKKLADIKKNKVNHNTTTNVIEVTEKNQKSKEAKVLK